MDKQALISYLKLIDRGLASPARLCIYGSGALMLMDEPGRGTLDLDVAAPYSTADYGDLEQAARQAGLPVNPDESYAGEHIEWISSLRLCLAAPDADNGVILWQGAKLVVITVSPADLVASKLIRYDDTDQADILFLCTQGRVAHEQIEAAVRRLPPPFRDDALVVENLANLKVDMRLWLGEEGP